MAVEFLRGNDFIYDRLSADATLAAEIGDRIFPDQAEEGAEYPFVTYQYIGGADFMVLGGVRIQTQGVFLVKATNKSDTYASIRTAADRIDALLHNTKGPAGSDGVVFSCVREAVDPLPMETDNGVNYVAIAGRYRLSIQV